VADKQQADRLRLNLKITTEMMITESFSQATAKKRMLHSNNLTWTSHHRNGYVTFSSIKTMTIMQLISKLVASLKT
jgi:hypothetical protein